MMMTSRQGHHSLRIGRRSFAGQVYLLTTVTYLRRPYFLDAEVARLVVRSLSSPERWFPSRCLAWVLMPDHWHGLVELGDAETLAAVMRRVKGGTARLAGIHDPHAKPLWAKGFHDRALRCDESVRCAARYIVANPVRAGLAETVLDYPYWDACFMDGEGAIEGLD
jgi:REP element-mobilizing transposase RayT